MCLNVPLDRSLGLYHTHTLSIGLWRPEHHQYAPHIVFIRAADGNRKGERTRLNTACERRFVWKATSPLRAENAFVSDTQARSSSSSSWVAIAIRNLNIVDDDVDTHTDTARNDIIIIIVIWTSSGHGGSHSSSRKVAARTVATTIDIKPCSPPPTHNLLPYGHHTSI